jgi:imidazolonepropionase-like amidohydrolase
MNWELQRKISLRLWFVLVALSVACGVSRAQSPPANLTTFVKAARLLDVKSGSYVEQAGIWIEGDRIKRVGRSSEIQPLLPADARVIDLHDKTVLPGLIDCHTHLMARFASGPDGYILGLAQKSQAYRALEGAADAKATLFAGFTSVRDVESEGSGYADVALRDAIEAGLVEGPRMKVATRGIAAVGQYNPFGVSPDLVNFPTGAQMISGAEEARRAVREQIGNGADLIKVYADWAHPTLTIDEMRVIVEEAHKAGLKVAAHATTAEGIKNAVTAGVDSIEHGFGADRADIALMKQKGVFLVPTVGTIDLRLEAQRNQVLSPEQIKRRDTLLQSARQMIQMAMSGGVKIASGFDASSAERHGRNAQELLSLVSRGMTPLAAIRAATLNAAELIGTLDSVGSIEAGRYADLIAVRGDPLEDITILTHVAFVMKNGAVVKDGN